MLSHEVWAIPPNTITLAEGDVHVWWAELDRPGDMERPANLLAPDELARAGRYRAERDRRRFVGGRGVLRMLLGRYLETAPEQIVFGYGPAGKPYLAAPASPIEFSMSHTGGLAVYAYALGRAVGVDVERVREIADSKQLAERFFTAGERTALAGLPEDRRLEGFLSCWTRKEAYLKARGIGLLAAPDQVEVSVAPDEPARLLKVAWDAREVAAWSLRTLPPIDGCVGALCVEGDQAWLRFWVSSCWAR